MLRYLDQPFLQQMPYRSLKLILTHLGLPSDHLRRRLIRKRHRAVEALDDLQHFLRILLDLQIGLLPDAQR